MGQEQIELFGESIRPDRSPKYVKNGHAGIPGNGPQGETCKTCRHLAKRYLSRTYYKCGLCRQNWTGSYGTDVLLKSPACQFWEAP